MAIPSDQQFDDAARDLVTIDEFANSQELMTNTRRGNTIPTLTGVLSNVAVSAGLGYELLSDLEQIQPTDGLMAEVTNDGKNTGRYRGNGTKWVKSDNPTAQKVADLEQEMPNKLDKTTQHDNEALVMIVDSENRTTWLGARKKDGGPTAHAERMMRGSLGMPIMSNRTMMFAIVDSLNRLTDVALDRKTGQFMEFVVQRLAPRIQQYLDIPMQGPRIIESLYPQYESNITDMTKLAGWGSSSMEKSASFIQALATSLNMDYHQGGIGTTQSAHIAARLGAIPAQLTFPNNTIPASGTVTVTTPTFSPNARQDYTGTVFGVHGRFFYSGNDAQFTRTAAGDPVSIEPDSPFLPDTAAQFRGGVNLLWMGRNDLTGVPGQAEAVIRNTDASFDFMVPLEKRVLVIGHMIGQNQQPGAVWDQIVQVNEAHRKRYGYLYVDVMEYLLSAQIWADSGLTPTQADLDNQAAGKVPPSFAASTTDGLHLSQLGYQLLVEKVFKRKLIQLGWIFAS